MPKKPWLVCGLSFLISIFAAEVFLSVFFPFFTVKDQPHPAPRLETFGPYSHRLSPNQTVHQTVKGEFDVVFHINSDGFRGEELNRGLPSILLLGDSQVFGTGLEDDATIGAQLQRMLTKSLGRKIQVINAGTPGSASFNHKYLLEMRGRELKPAIVISALFAENALVHDEGNDLYQNWRFHLRQTHAAVNSPAESPRPSATFPFLGRHSELYGLVSYSLRKLNHQTQGELVAAYPRDPQNQETLKRAWRFTEELISEMQKFSEKVLQAPFAILHLDSATAYALHDGETKRAVMQFNLPTISVSDSLRSQLSQKPQAIYFWEGHYRPQAAQHIAQQLHDFILREPRFKRALNP